MVFDGYRLDLSNVKLVFCDFDDTLCIHLHNNVTRPTEAQWRALRKSGREDLYTKQLEGLCVPNELLHKWLLSYVKSAEKYLISWTEMNVIRAKYRFVEENYADVPFAGAIRVENREDKVKVIKSITSERGLSLDEVLLIEDHPCTVTEAQNAGVMCISTAEVQYMVMEELSNERNS